MTNKDEFSEKYKTNKSDTPNWYIFWCLVCWISSPFIKIFMFYMCSPFVHVFILNTRYMSLQRKDLNDRAELAIQLWGIRLWLSRGTQCTVLIWLYVKKKPLCFGETFAWGWAATLKAAGVCLMCSYPGSMSPARCVTGLTEANWI